MNKYDAFIHDYLIQNKQVTLEKIGVLQITADQKQPENSNNPIPVVQFSYDRKAETDSLLLDHIAEKAVKNRALVAADLSSYLEQVRQFINIGKPYVIPGIGAIFMIKNSDYDFSQQTGVNFAASPVTQAIPEHYLEANAEEVGRIRKKNGLAGIAVLVVVLVVAGVGWGIYNLVKGNKTTTDVTQEAPVTEPVAASIPDSLPKPAADTQPLPAATTAAPVSAAPNTNGGYKFIFETTASSERARVRIEQLKSFGDPAGFDSTKQSDGTFMYRLFLRQQITPADSARAKDSIQRYLDKSVVLEKE